jgi:hypothetical protein
MVTLAVHGRAFHYHLDPYCLEKSAPKLNASIKHSPLVSEEK